MGGVTEIDLTPDRPRTEHLLSRIHDGAWLDAQTFPPLQWAVPGLIAEGMGLLVGPPKLGKSWFALGVGLAVAQGGYALGRIRVEQRPVLYAALEDGNRRMQYRCRHLLDDQPIPSGFQYFTDARGADEALAILTAWLDRHPGGLVMLDTLGKVLPSAAPGQSAYERDYAIGSVLKGIADDHPGSAFLIVHHTRKMASSDFMDATSGTNGLNGSADYTVVLERVRGEDSARIKVTGRDVTEGEYAARMPGGAWLLDGDDLTQAAETARTERATDGLGDDSAQVVAFIGEHPEGVTPAQVAARMGWPDNKTRTYLARLLDGGRVNRPSRGRYTPVASVASVAFNGDGEGERNNATPSVAFQHPASPAEITQATEATHSSGPSEWTDPRWGRCAVANGKPTPVAIDDWHQWRAAGSPPIAVPGEVA